MGGLFCKTSKHTLPPAQRILYQNKEWCPALKINLRRAANPRRVPPETGSEGAAAAAAATASADGIADRASMTLHYFQIE